MSSPAYINIENKNCNKNQDEITNLEKNNGESKYFGQQIKANSEIDSESDDFVFLYSSINGEIVQEKKLPSPTSFKRALSQESSKSIDAEIDDCNFNIVRLLILEN